MVKKKKYTEVLTTPYETGIRNFTEIAKYFQYYAPNIDSVHSYGKILGDRADKIFNKLIASAGMTKDYKTLKKVKANSWNEFNLDDEKLDFEKARMIFDVFSKENELGALLRHIRNALAHGNIYIWRKKSKGNFIFLVDYDNNKKKITAKIMISSYILEQWKAILENEIALGE